MPLIVSRVRSHIVVSDAGTPAVNGLYAPSSEAAGGRPMWVHMQNPNVCIHWSMEAGSWIMDTSGDGVPYRLPNRYDPTPPSDASWETFGNGEEPTPSIRFLALCSIVISKANVAEVNGVYVPVDEVAFDRPMWSHLKDSRWKIQWSEDAGVWVIKHESKGVKYWSRTIGCLPGDADYDPTPCTTQWIPLKPAR